MRKQKKEIRILEIIMILSCLIITSACSMKKVEAFENDNSNEEEKGNIEETYGFDFPRISYCENNSKGIKFNWKKIEGVENYRIFRKTKDSDWEILGDTSQTSFLDENVKAEEKYKYAIRCLDSSGENYLSGYDEEGKEVIYVVLDTPKLISITRVTDGIEVKWESEDGNKYRVVRKTDDGKWKKIGETNEMFYVDNDVKSGKNYTYSVKCVNEDFTVVQSNYDHKGLSLKYIMLDNPVLLNVENEENGVKVTWEAVKDANKYRIFHKVKDGEWEKVLDTTSTECIDEGVINGETYTYTVRCLSEDGKYYLSDYDNNGVSITYLKR